MTEPDVALTDYALALFSLGSMIRLRRAPRVDQSLRRAWELFFLTIALGALAGGTVHGFFLNEDSMGHRLLWPFTLLMIGATASTGWVLTGGMISTHRLALWRAGAILVFLIYATIVLFFSQKFIVVIVNYVPALIAMLMAAIWRTWRYRDPRLIWIASGVLVSFGAAGLQQAQIAIHPQYFTHNSTYHLVQGFALWNFYQGARRL